jgi:hypothetical protein
VVSFGGRLDCRRRHHLFYDPGPMSDSGCTSAHHVVCTGTLLSSLFAHAIAHILLFFLCKPCGISTYSVVCRANDTQRSSQMCISLSKCPRSPCVHRSRWVKKKRGRWLKTRGRSRSGESTNTNCTVVVMSPFYVIFLKNTPLQSPHHLPEGQFRADPFQVRSWMFFFGVLAACRPSQRGRRSGTYGPSLAGQGNFRCGSGFIACVPALSTLAETGSPGG